MLVQRLRVPVCRVVEKERAGQDLLALRGLHIARLHDVERRFHAQHAEPDDVGRIQHVVRVDAVDGAEVVIGERDDIERVLEPSRRRKQLVVVGRELAVARGRRRKRDRLDRAAKVRQQDAYPGRNDGGEAAAEAVAGDQYGDVRVRGLRKESRQKLAERLSVGSQSLNDCETIERAGRNARRIIERPRHRLRVGSVEVFPDLPEHAPDIGDVEIGAAQRDADGLRCRIRAREVARYERKVRLVAVLHRPPDALPLSAGRKRRRRVCTAAGIAVMSGR